MGTTAPGPATSPLAVSVNTVTLLVPTTGQPVASAPPATYSRVPAALSAAPRLHVPPVAVLVPGPATSPLGVSGNTDTVLLALFTTYSRVAAGLTISAVGPTAPTGSGTTVPGPARSPLGVSGNTVRLLLPRLATYSRLPGGLVAMVRNSDRAPPVAVLTPGGSGSPVPLSANVVTTAPTVPTYRRLPGDGRGVMTVRSAAVSFAAFCSPPPDTVAVLVTLIGAVAATFTVRVMLG